MTEERPRDDAGKRSGKRGEGERKKREERERERMREARERMREAREKIEREKESKTEKWKTQEKEGDALHHERTPS